jgi:hypothetical protein
MSDFTYAMSIASMTVIGTGIIGNVLTFIVFSRKTFRKNSISTYSRAIVIFSSFTLPQIINFILSRGFNYNFPTINDALCKLWNYLPETYSSIPAWILVAFSLDKYISMRISQKTILNKKWFQIAVVSGIVIFDFCAYMWVPILAKRTEFQPGVFVCSLAALTNIFSAYMIFFATESCLVPFVIMIILSILTIRLLVKSRQNVERTGRVDKERKSRDFRYAVTSITFNILFVVLKTPIMVYYILNAYNVVSNVYFNQIAILFFYASASNNFFVHIISNSLFRREFFALFGLRRKNRVNMRIRTESIKDDHDQVNTATNNIDS